MNGLILTGVCPGAGGEEYNEKYDKNLTRMDGRDIVSCPLKGADLGTRTGFSEGGLRLRGTGGGMTGRPSYICVNSASVGIGVVRALRISHQLSRSSLGWEQKLT